MMRIMSESQVGDVEKSNPWPLPNRGRTLALAPHSAARIDQPFFRESVPNFAPTTGPCFGTSRSHQLDNPGCVRPLCMHITSCAVIPFWSLRLRVQCNSMCSFSARYTPASARTQVRHRFLTANTSVLASDSVCRSIFWTFDALRYC